MAAVAKNQNDKILKLVKYAEGLKQRLHNTVPEKHNKSEDSRVAYKQMLQIDLKKTENQIAKLK